MSFFLELEIFSNKRCIIFFSVLSCLLFFSLAISKGVATELWIFSACSPCFNLLYAKFKSNQLSSAEITHLLISETIRDDTSGTTRDCRSNPTAACFFNTKYFFLLLGLSSVCLFKSA